MTDAAIIFRTHFEAIKALPKEQRLEAYEALIEYCLDDAVPEDGLPLAMVTMAAPVLDKWKAKRKAGEAGGKQTGSKREANVKQTESKAEAETKQAEANANLKKEKEKEYIYINNIKEKVSSIEDTKKKVARFVKPTVEDVRAYCLERKNGIDAERFVDYYESNGWKVGKNPMKDWRACVRSWEKNSNTQVKSAPPNRFNNFENSLKYDFGAIEQAALTRARDG